MKLLPPDSRRRRLLAAGLLAPLLPGTARAQAPAAPPAEISPAERALFERPHLAGLAAGEVLRYHLRHAGSLEAGYDDPVSITLGARADGGCCSAQGSFLDGPRRLALPEIPSATSNPVILFFLEHDVREMQRLTRGQSSHFRRRIRLALAGQAGMRSVQARWRGQPVAADEIVVQPYADDPSRYRFERHAAKTYRFVLSDAVPGGVVALQTTMAAAEAGAPPLIEDRLTLDGAEAPATAAG